uniref:LisH domain-containing protein n=1 Tax=Anopheles dirus TaxID=7168 RepID=A0A182NQD3_9DIPT
MHKQIVLVLVVSVLAANSYPTDYGHHSIGSGSHGAFGQGHFSQPLTGGPGPKVPDSFGIGHQYPAHGSSSGSSASASSSSFSSSHGGKMTGSQSHAQSGSQIGGHGGTISSAPQDRNRSSKTPMDTMTMAIMGQADMVMGQADRPVLLEHTHSRCLFMQRTMVTTKELVDITSKFLMELESNDIAHMVYNYLLEVRLMEAAELFFKTSPHLTQEQQLQTDKIPCNNAMRRISQVMHEFNDLQQRRVPGAQQEQSTASSEPIKLTVQSSPAVTQLSREEALAEWNRIRAINKSNFDNYAREINHQTEIKERLDKVLQQKQSRKQRNSQSKTKSLITKRQLEEPQQKEGLKLVKKAGRVDKVKATVRVAVDASKTEKGDGGTQRKKQPLKQRTCQLSESSDSACSVEDDESIRQMTENIKRYRRQRIRQPPEPTENKQHDTEQSTEKSDSVLISSISPQCHTKLSVDTSPPKAPATLRKNPAKTARNVRTPAKAKQESVTSTARAGTARQQQLRARKLAEAAETEKGENVHDTPMQARPIIALSLGSINTPAKAITIAPESSPTEGRRPTRTCTTTRRSNEELANRKTKSNEKTPKKTTTPRKKAAPVEQSTVAPDPTKQLTEEVNGATDRDLEPPPPAAGEVAEAAIYAVLAQLHGTITPSNGFVSRVLRLQPIVASICSSFAAVIMHTQFVLVLAVCALAAHGYPTDHHGSGSSSGSSASSNSQSAGFGGGFPALPGGHGGFGHGQFSQPLTAGTGPNVPGWSPDVFGKGFPFPAPAHGSSSGSSSSSFSSSFSTGHGGKMTGSQSHAQSGSQSGGHGGATSSGSSAGSQSFSGDGHGHQGSSSGSSAGAQSGSHDHHGQHGSSSGALSQSSSHGQDHGKDLHGHNGVVGSSSGAQSQSSSADHGPHGQVGTGSSAGAQSVSQDTHHGHGHAPSGSGSSAGAQSQSHHGHGHAPSGSGSSAGAQSQSQSSHAQDHGHHQGAGGHGSGGHQQFQHGQRGDGEGYGVRLSTDESKDGTVKKTESEAWHKCKEPVELDFKIFNFHSLRFTTLDIL